MSRSFGFADLQLSPLDFRGHSYSAPELFKVFLNLRSFQSQVFANIVSVCFKRVQSEYQSTYVGDEVVQAPFVQCTEASSAHSIEC